MLPYEIALVKSLTLIWSIPAYRNIQCVIYVFCKSIQLNGWLDIHRQVRIDGLLGRTIKLDRRCLFCGIHIKPYPRWYWVWLLSILITTRLEQNVRHSADDISNAFSWLRRLNFDSNFNEFVLRAQLIKINIGCINDLPPVGRHLKHNWPRSILSLNFTGEFYIRWQGRWIRRLISIFRFQHFIWYENETYFAR